MDKEQKWKGRWREITKKPNCKRWIFPEGPKPRRQTYTGDKDARTKYLEEKNEKVFDKESRWYVENKKSTKIILLEPDVFNTIKEEWRTRKTPRHASGRHEFVANFITKFDGALKKDLNMLFKELSKAKTEELPEWYTISGENIENRRGPGTDTPALTDSRREVISAAVPARSKKRKKAEAPVDDNQEPIQSIEAASCEGIGPGNTWSSSHDISKVNSEQQRDWQDFAVEERERLYHIAILMKPQTFYSRLSRVGIDVRKGSAAQTSLSLPDADFLIGNCHDLDEWLKKGTGDKVFVLRDQQFIEDRPKKYGSRFLQDLQASGCTSVDVQNSGKEYSPDANSAERFDISDVIKNKDPLKPLNLLEVKCVNGAGLIPWPLAKHCTVLSDAVESDALRAASAGRESTEGGKRAVDLQSSIYFQIFGQAGAISSWHMDSIGPYTYVTLEPDKPGEDSSDVFKLWAFVRTDHLSPAEEEEVWKDFKQHGGDYKPPKELIKVISFRPEDTLYMPPGTIHGPLTIGDSLLRGGMVMQKRQIARSIQAWRFCSDNLHCTNEDPKKQARGVLDKIRDLVRTEPAACGYGEEDGLAKFEEDWQEIGGISLQCQCEGACSMRCVCFIAVQRCGNRCHGGRKKCNNKYGCEESVQCNNKYGCEESVQCNNKYRCEESVQIKKRRRTKRGHR